MLRGTCNQNRRCPRHQQHSPCGPLRKHCKNQPRPQVVMQSLFNRGGHLRQHSSNHPHSRDVLQSLFNCPDSATGALAGSSHRATRQTTEQLRPRRRSSVRRAPSPRPCTGQQKQRQQHQVLHSLPSNSRAGRNTKCCTACHRTVKQCCTACCRNSLVADIRNAASRRHLRF